MNPYKLSLISGGIFFSVVAAGFILYLAGIVTPPLPQEFIQGDQQKDPFVYGKELLLSGKYPEAEEALKEALRHDPSHVKALSALGTLYYRQGDIKLAYQYWTEALKIAPGEPTLQSLVKAIEQDKFREGPLYHMQIQTIDHAESWAQHFQEGQNLYLKGEYSQAIEELTKAGSLKPDDPGIYFVLGATYLKMNNRDKTIQAWEKVLKMNPGDPVTRDLLNRVKSREKEG